MRRPPVRRLVALFAFLLFSLTVIMFRLAVLQIRDARAYEHMAMSQRLRTIQLPAQRGRQVGEGFPGAKTPAVDAGKHLAGAKARLRKLREPRLDLFDACAYQVELLRLVHRFFLEPIILADRPH